MNSVNGMDYDFNINSHSIPVKLLHKFVIGSSKNYVLKSTTNNSTNSRFAVALSNCKIKIYDHHGTLFKEYDHSSIISHLKFSSAESNILFASSLEGKILVWDLRSHACVQTFFDDSDGSLKPILSFDYNPYEEIICGGTELIREDAFHLFWDRRSSKILGGYWNSHSGDITRVNFHPLHSSWMASSSLDGLINLFDVNETSEDDALIRTINVEAPVNAFTWKSENIVSCITSIEEHHLIDIESLHPILSTSRDKLSQNMEIRTDCVIDTLQVKDNFLLATGQNSGSVHLWRITENDPLKYNFFTTLSVGHTDVVRTICFNESAEILLTGGDDGCVCLWKLKSGTQ